MCLPVINHRQDVLSEEMFFALIDHNELKGGCVFCVCGFLLLLLLLSFL